MPVTTQRGDRAGQVELRDVTIGFPTDTGRFVAVQDCSLAIRPNEFLSVVGPSGCGKSTMLFAVDGLYEPSAGQILVDGRPIEGPNPDRAMVFQEFGLFPWRTIWSNVEFPLELRATPKKMSRAERREVAERYLRLVGLEGFGSRYPHQLSGGMKQRVGIARAFATGAEILLMDEPFASVDAQTRDIMGLELLRVWNKERKTVVFVTHSIEEAVFLADRIVVMTHRPARIKSVVTLDEPRPRDINNARLSAVKADLYASMAIERTAA